MKAPIPRLLLIISVLLLTLKAFSQDSDNPRAMFVEAESYFLFEEYKDALPNYHKLLRLEPENYNLMYKIGICYLNDPYQKEKSIRYLLDASKHINKEYKTNSFKEKLAPPEVNYYLGQAYRVNNQFDKSLEYYSLFKKDLDPLVFDVEVVNEEIASCQVAKKMLTSPVYFVQNNIGNQLNSRFSESNVVLSGDGKTLIFTRAMQFYDGLFITTKDESGNWSPPYNLTPDFGLDGNSYSTGISFNGDEIFVYRSDNFDGNIYSSKLVDGKWQVLKKLNDNINTKYWESHASPSPDGKFLYFTSNRKDGYGGLDIYKSPRLANGDWGTPINLGPIINSKYNEDAPFISPDNKLFFSSLGHNGMGGYDIFVSEMVGPSSWARPVNMGYPLNTPDDDIFFCPVKDKNATGIYAAYDQNSTFGLHDIYWAKVYNSILPREYTITGKVDVPSEDLLDDGNIVISIIDNKLGKIVEQVTANESGEFTLKTNQGDYQLLVDGKGINPVSLPLTLNLTQEESEIAVPLITAQASTKGEENQIAITSEQPKLEIIGNKNIITEESPIEIKLNVEAGNRLVIENYIGSMLDRKEELVVSKNKFTYKFYPKPGDNLLIFSIYDDKGNVNKQEMTVYYKPADEIAPITAQIVQPTKLTEISALTSGNLQKYLNSLQNYEYSTLTDLYEMLSANAAANGYTQTDVDKLIALLLSQRNKEEFIAETRKNNNLELIYANDSLISVSNLPIIIVQKTGENNPQAIRDMDNNLINVIPFTGSSDEILDYILSFADTNTVSMQVSGVTDIYNSLNSLIKPNQVKDAIELASTTENLDQFYFNLLSVTDAELKKLLLGINFESDSILNSIDLVEYLFSKANEGKLDIKKLISAIESAKQNRMNNLLQFKESLANAATGGLKAHIQELDITNPATDSYLGIIETLLRDSKTKGYNKSEVYEMLIKMIGIDNVEDFIEAMRKYTTGDLDSLLATIDPSQFSKPIELIQYLLSESANYDFSDSDINKLLLRMLLEKGLSGHELGQGASYSQELIKRRRFVTSLVLANVLIVILLFLFWRRRKKKNDKLNE